LTRREFDLRPDLEREQLPRPQWARSDDGSGGYDPVLAFLTTSPAQISSDDDRVRRALFTLRESAAYLDLPASTLHQWARPSDGPGLVTIFSRAGRSATIPFVGFAEAYVLSALRHGGVPMQRIRPAVARLSEEFGLDHALASQRVYTDGAELIFDYASSSDDDALLTVVRTGQEHLAEVIRGYLKRIAYGGDGWAAQIQLPAYTAADVIVDPERAFGQPLVVHGGARVEDLVDRFRAGDSVADIAEDFAVPRDEVEDVIRVATRLAA
jgi:uncharacterized protein (DUF433 family)